MWQRIKSRESGRNSECLEPKPLHMSSAPNIPAPPRTFPLDDRTLRGAFGRLPTELVLEVFSHLDYFTLLRLRRVCRRFHNIRVEHANSLREQTFGLETNHSTEDTSTDSSNEPIQLFDIHPCIGDLEVYHNKKGGGTQLQHEDLGFCKRKERKFVPITSTNVLWEMAVIPTKKLEIGAFKPESFAFIRARPSDVKNLTVMRLINTLIYELGRRIILWGDPGAPARSVSPYPLRTFLTATNWVKHHQYSKENGLWFTFYKINLLYGDDQAGVTIDLVSRLGRALFVS